MTFLGKGVLCQTGQVVGQDKNYIKVGKTLDFMISKNNQQVKVNAYVHAI